MVTFHYIHKDGDDIKVTEDMNERFRKKQKFYTSNEEIEWSTHLTYVLNRKNLILKKMTFIKDKTYIVRQCEVFSKKTYFKKMNKLSDIYQKKYNDKNKGNKI